MLKGPPSLDDLIELVNQRTEGGNGLARLAEASSISSELSALTDQLVDYFVQQARESGMSWSQIGQQLGVTKQGAQQRFTGQSRMDRLEDLPQQLRDLTASLEEKFLNRSPSASGGLLQKVRSAFKPHRFTAAARQVVILAQEEARELHHDKIGAEHILLGLLREESGVAASTLRSVGVTLEQVRNQVAEQVEPSPDAPSGHIPFTSGARDALESAMTESANLRHNYIGTEHVLLGLLKEHNMARDVLTRLDINVDHLTHEVYRLLERL
jgi:DNA-binding transcriptional MerR regulator